ncbi:MAG TPA: hypothetical protein DCY93_04020 [Firmicutes bacterium]|nr:hypothetical protein [Bacillota bacterium]
MKKELIEENYGITLLGLVKLSDKTYKVFTEEEAFLLKKHDDEYIENIFIRLKMLSIDYFHLPVLTKQGNYLLYDEDKRYALYHYYDDESVLNKDIRLHFYTKALAELHSLSSFPVNVADGYFVDKLDFLQKQIDDKENELLFRVKRIEREDYHSPEDWYFYMNYQHFHLALQTAKKYLDDLDEAYKTATDLHLCLTYQNFDYRHILVRAQKILSLDKMALASPVNDLLFLFDDKVSFTIDSTVFLKEYFSIYQMSKYEIYELLTLLFIPQKENKPGIKEDIDDTSKAIRFLNRVEKVAKFISSTIS